MSPEPASVQDRLTRHGLVVPVGYRITSFAERPDLEPAIRAGAGGDFEPFMLEDAVANEHFDTAYAAFPEFQLIVVDDAGELAGIGNAMPLCWDGTADGLPAGWDDQVLRSVADRDAGRSPDTLGAMLIYVPASRRGAGLAGLLLGGFRAAAREAGYRALIACVRPTAKERYPLTPIERYAAWTRDDGLPLDPWIRLHVRFGGRIVRASPESMTIRGTVADWESWTGLRFPERGAYVVSGATAPVWIDVERDEGVYHDQNVWVVHDLS